ncbi:hypothetical protein [Celeribacter naphthalenivorans]|uniref:hypothetical protein n=1 Tax=Celeribacter naphthalenivorans TaxID=1614694 RepID=UPI001CFB90E6|nr:hypothetical protein [Celeribacter naphthalenivorans]
MIDQITNHAKAAAAAHGVSVRVYAGEEFENDRWTGRFFCTVEFHQSVYTRPENKKSLVSDIENRRIIGVSAPDARRLFKSRKGVPGGQEYVITRNASEVISHVADTPEEAEREVLNVILSGAARALAHKVADRAAQIEVEMRAQLRTDLNALEAA